MIFFHVLIQRLLVAESRRTKETPEFLRPIVAACHVAFHGRLRLFSVSADGASESKMAAVNFSFVTSAILGGGETLAAQWAIEIIAPDSVSVFPLNSLCDDYMRQALKEKVW